MHYIQHPGGSEPLFIRVKRHVFVVVQRAALLDRVQILNHNVNIEAETVVQLNLSDSERVAQIGREEGGALGDGLVAVQMLADFDAFEMFGQNLLDDRHSDSAAD